MTLTEALARDMFANEHDDAAPGATDEAWSEDADLRDFWTARSTTRYRLHGRVASPGAPRSAAPSLRVRLHHDRLLLDR